MLRVNDERISDVEEIRGNWTRNGNKYTSDNGSVIYLGDDVIIRDGAVIRSCLFM